MTDDLLTTAEVATRLAVHPSRVRHWISEGKLPAHKHGRDLFVSAQDLDCFRRPQMGRPRKDHDEAALAHAVERHDGP